MTTTLNALPPVWPDDLLPEIQTRIKKSGKKIVVLDDGYRDQEVFVADLLLAEAAGKRFVYRTAASFVRVRGGIAPRNPLIGNGLAGASANGGLIVAGSYFRKGIEL